MFAFGNTKDNMWLGRFNKGDYSDYWISPNKQEPIQFKVYSEPPRIEMDYYCGEDMVILRKYDVERGLNIVLKPLEQIEL